jgi:redox-sensitive bicupin YhaK (pirin superfamily)
MKTVLHKAETRGHGNYGWLDTHYTFSFANYYDPGRVHFGTLRVLNDDRIDGGGGFDRHPHDNMEIITVVLEGVLEHQDSMGHRMQIRKDEIQVMSAGTGIFHSEYNKDPEAPLTLLQIWVFPERKNLTPRYDQRFFDPAGRLNKWQKIVAPDDPEALFINQNAVFSRITLEKGHQADYALYGKDHGVYIFVIDGAVSTGEVTLAKRDGAGLSGLHSLTLQAAERSEILLMEVPMGI